MKYFALLFALLSALPLNAQNYYHLDPAFGNTGHVIPQYPGHDRGHAIAIQPDQKIVVTGYSNSSCIVARFLPNGSPDLAFGNGGSVTLNFGIEQYNTEGTAVQLLPDGRILVAGGARAPYYGLGLARLLPDGQPDPAFGVGGMVNTDDGGNDYRLRPARALAVSAVDGRITVAAVRDTVADPDYQCAVLRFLPDGTPDATFGSGGKAWVNAFDGDVYNEAPNALLLLPNGAIVLAGVARTGSLEDCFIGRLTPAGAPDPAFGTGGIVLAFGTEYLQLVLQPNGRIIAVGHDGSSGQKHVLLARYFPSGNLDPSFGSGGVAVSSGGWHHGNGVALEPDGRIVVAGFHRTGSLVFGYTYLFHVARFTDAGLPDPDFAPGGRLSWLINGDDEELHKVALQANGRIVSVGYYHNDAGFDDLILTGLTRDSLPGLPPGACFTAEMTGGCAPYFAAFHADCSSDATGYAWQFPGGNPASSTAANPVVAYAAEGVYPVTLVVYNDAGSDSLTVSAYITVTAPPTAGFTATVDGATATFGNSSTGASSYVWDFGDSLSSTEASPAHVYAADGIYTVTLIATGPCGTDTFTQSVTVAAPPVAGFTADVTAGCAPLTVEFTSTSSANTTGLLWEFPGGLPATSTENAPLVTYAAPGVYPVTLVATAPGGIDSIVQNDFITVDTAPVASFTFTVDAGIFVFTNTSQHATEFSWAFGDGDSSLAANPVHTFAATGQYVVTLTATNACGSHTVQLPLLVGAGEAAGLLAAARLYPNPTRGDFTVELPAGADSGPELLLYDLAGRRIPLDVLSSGAGTIRVRLSDPAPGLYLLHLHARSGRAACRLVVER
jgi:uncharacterized delta-60 repeat protein